MFAAHAEVSSCSINLRKSKSNHSLATPKHEKCWRVKHCGHWWEEEKHFVELRPFPASLGLLLLMRPANNFWWVYDSFNTNWHITFIFCIHKLSVEFSNSGQMRPHFAFAIYHDRCAFLDLELVIMCNRKSVDALLAAVSIGTSLKIAFEVCLLIVVSHSAAYINTLLILSFIYYLIMSEIVETYLCWDCLPTSAVYHRSFSGTQRVPMFHRCSFFGLY